jgi:hypothetical protein
MYVGPHRLLANTQRGSPSPPPRGAEEGIGRSARLPGQYWYSCQLKNGAMNLSYVRHDNNIVIPNGRTRWRGNLKGLSHDRGQVKSAENIGGSLFKRDLLTPLSAKSILLESPLRQKM